MTDKEFMEALKIMKEYHAKTIIDLIQGLELERDHYRVKYEAIKKTRSYDDEFVEEIVEDNERQAKHIKILTEETAAWMDAALVLRSKNLTLEEEIDDRAEKAYFDGYKDGVEAEKYETKMKIYGLEG